MSVVADDVGTAVAQAAGWAVSQGVAVELWPPDELELSGSIRYRRRPLLLLVAPGAAPPALDDLSTAVALPGDADEVIARARTLCARARTAGMVLTYVDSDDVLRMGNRLVVLSPIEAKMMRILLEHPGRVVSRERFNQEIWPDRPRHDFATLNGRLRLLRRHIADLPLRIHSVRRRGLILVTDDAPFTVSGT
ncbi:MAG: winged helix-turn-helix domain-containing protein [Acidimicrobiia bacterium]|nr:winged helix-turn-helix domain-containing protein [Acidimicrobiia bacterium]